MKIRANILSIGAALSLSVFATNTLGATPTFNNLSQDDFDKISREFSSNSSWHSVTPPSSMGSIFGFEIGLVAGASQSPEIDAKVKEVSPGTDVKAIPHGALLGAVTVPFGITVEAMLLPKIETSGVNYQQFGGAIKWVPTDSLLVLPVNLAVRGFVTKSEFSFNQTVTDTALGQPVNATVKQDGTVSGLQLMVSPSLLPVIEPYVGIGYLSGNSKMSVTGVTASDFFQFTNSQSAESKPTSTQFLLGADIRLLLIGFGLEYERSFGTDSFTGKFSLKF